MYECEKTFRKKLNIRNKQVTYMEGKSYYYHRYEIVFNIASCLRIHQKIEEKETPGAREIAKGSGCIFCMNQGLNSNPVTTYFPRIPPQCNPGSPCILLSMKLKVSKLCQFGIVVPSLTGPDNIIA